MFHNQCNRLIEQQAALIDQLASRTIELEAALSQFVSVPPQIDLAHKGTVHYLGDKEMLKLEEQ